MKAACIPPFAWASEAADLYAHGAMLAEIHSDASPIVACIDQQWRPRLDAPPRVKRTIVRVLWASLASEARP